MTAARKDSGNLATLFVEKGLRATRARTTILRLLMAADHALSHTEVVHAVRKQGETFERVTLYRVLDWLVKNELAHKITGTDRMWRFSAQARPLHNHAHFNCTRCGHVYCLENLTPKKALKLPGGFQLQHADVSIQGLCPHCSH